MGLYANGKFVYDGKVVAMLKGPPRKTPEEIKAEQEGKKAPGDSAASSSSSSSSSSGGASNNILASVTAAGAGSAAGGVAVMLAFWAGTVPALLGLGLGLGTALGGRLRRHVHRASCDAAFRRLGLDGVPAPGEKLPPERARAKSRQLSRLRSQPQRCSSPMTTRPI